MNKIALYPYKYFFIASTLFLFSPKGSMSGFSDKVIPSLTNSQSAPIPRERDNLRIKITKTKNDEIEFSDLSPNSLAKVDKTPSFILPSPAPSGQALSFGNLDIFPRASLQSVAPSSQASNWTPISSCNSRSNALSTPRKKLTIQELVDPAQMRNSFISNSYFNQVDSSHYNHKIFFSKTCSKKSLSLSGEGEDSMHQDPKLPNLGLNKSLPSSLQKIHSECSATLSHDTPNLESKESSLPALGEDKKKCCSNKTIIIIMSIFSTCVTLISSIIIGSKANCDC